MFVDRVARLLGDMGNMGGGVSRGTASTDDTMTAFSTEFSEGEIWGSSASTMSEEKVVLETSEFSKKHEIQHAVQSSERAMETDEGASCFQLSQCSDESMSATFSITFPLAVSQLILQHEAALEAKVETLKGVYVFEAGYDIVPSDCRLIVNEQVGCFGGIEPILSHR